MDNKKLIVLLSCTVFIVIMTTVGVTYAYLTYGAKQGTANVLSTSCFSVAFKEGAVINSIGFPTEDKTGLTTKPYTFEISNNGCSTTTNYQIILNVKKGTNMDLKLIRYSIDGTTANSLGNSISLPTGAPSTDVTSSYLIGSGSITNSTQSISKSLRVWISKDGTNAIMGQKFEAEIVVYSVPKTN